MKRFVTLILALAILTLSLGAAAENIGFGQLHIVGGWIGVCCNEWNRIFKADFGVDISFNTQNMKIISIDDDGIIVDLDGIIFNLDNDQNVISMRVKIMDDDVDTRFTDSRVCAVIAELCYEPGANRLDMAEQYNQIFGQYVDSFAEFVESKKDDYSATIIGPKATRKFYFHYTDRKTNECYFSTNDLSLENSNQDRVFAYTPYYLDEQRIVEKEFFNLFGVFAAKIKGAAAQGPTGDYSVDVLNDLNEQLKDTMYVCVEKNLYDARANVNSLLSVGSQEDCDALSDDDTRLYESLMSAADKFSAQMNKSVFDIYIKIKNRISAVANRGNLSKEDDAYISEQLSRYFEVIYSIDPTLAVEK